MAPYAYAVLSFLKEKPDERAHILEIRQALDCDISHILDLLDRLYFHGWINYYGDDVSLHNPPALV